ncbi:hypothetical protein Tco_0336141, partial [Tanacetum coccineum]
MWSRTTELFFDCYEKIVRYSSFPNGEILVVHGERPEKALQNVRYVEPAQRIQEKGFIRPSHSPWGAPVLFVKKKDEEEHEVHLKSILKLLKTECCTPNFQVRILVVERKLVPRKCGQPETVSTVDPSLARLSRSKKLEDPESPHRNTFSFLDYFKMDEQNMTMEKYIKLEEEKARKRGRVFNWKTATYGKIRVDDNLYDLRSMEAKFPAIIIDDAFTPKDALPCKSQVSTPVNDEIDFRISFDESDDEDYIIICDKNSFSYKMISVNNLKTDSKNDNENAGIPSFLLPKPTTSYVNDLDFFKDFENEFPAIVYNDAQTSKSDLLTEPILSPQHIDEFNLNDETSVSEYDEEEQNILYFNDR